MSVSVVIGGLISEALARFRGSHARAVEYYNMRVRSATQPTIFPVDIFNRLTGIKLMLVMTTIYITITIILLLSMQRQQTGLRLKFRLIAYNATHIVISGYIAAASKSFSQSKLLIYYHY
jgi:hypothetical protein